MKLKNRKAVKMTSETSIWVLGEKNGVDKIPVRLTKILKKGKKSLIKITNIKN